MKNIKISKWVKRGSVLLGSILIIVLVGPFFINVEGETGLMEPKQLVEKNGAIINILFKGTDGIETYYTYQPSKNNSDKNFILLHGSLYNTNTWDEVIDYFSTKGNVYAYDQVPYGLSEKVLEGEWTEENPYTIDAAVMQLESFMDVLNIESATLVGSSYGGVIAAEAALKIDEKVDELILVDAAIFVTESIPTWIMESPQAERVGPLIGRYLAKSDSFYESTFYNKDKLTEERMDLNKTESKINNWDLAFWEYLQVWGANPSDVNTKLGEIAQNTLVISGEYDELVPLNQSKKIASEIPNSTFQIIEETGHLPQEESPDKFIDVVDKWLNRE